MVLLPLGYYLFKDRRLFVRLGIPVVVGIVAHLCLMVSLFGRLYTVSSYLKANAMALHLYQNLFGSEIGYVVRSGLVFAMAGAAAWICWRRRSLPIGIVLLSALAFYGPHLLVSTLRHWYFLPAFMPLAYLVFRYRHDLPCPRFFTPTVYAVGAVLLLGFGLHYQVVNESDRINSHLFVAEVNRITSKDDVIFQIDGSGYMGYFLNAHVVNGDGLVNSYEYADRCRRNELAGYLDEIGATYIIHNRAAQGDLLIDRHGLKVSWNEVEKVFTVPLPSNNRYSVFTLYRLKRAKRQAAGAISLFPGGSSPFVDARQPLVHEADSLVF
jgi:hypothetical protein